jgi:hypothetical protein
VHLVDDAGDDLVVDRCSEQQEVAAQQVGGDRGPPCWRARPAISARPASSRSPTSRTGLGRPSWRRPRSGRLWLQIGRIRRRGWRSGRCPGAVWCGCRSR